MVCAKLWFRQDFGCRLSGVPLKDFGLRLQTLDFDELVSESSFSLQGLGCREQKLGTIFKLPLPLPRLLQQHWVWLVSLDRAQTIGHSRLDLFATQHLIMVWAWTFWLSDALGTRALLSPSPPPPLPPPTPPAQSSETSQDRVRKSPELAQTT